MPAVLTVREAGTERRIVFDARAVVGRDPDCDVVLSSRSVSRRHAILERAAEGWVVRDLGSANGLFVEGKRLAQATLAPGSSLRFGDVEATFESGGAPPDDERGASRAVALRGARPQDPARRAPRRRDALDRRARRGDDLDPFLRPRRPRRVGRAAPLTSRRLPRAAFGPLGRVHPRVSRAGFGCYRVDDRSETHRRALAAALDAGVNLIDTSTNYADGHSETLVGEVLADAFARGAVRREDVVVVTKIGYLQGSNLDEARATRAGRAAVDGDRRVRPRPLARDLARLPRGPAHGFARAARARTRGSPPSPQPRVFPDATRRTAGSRGKRRAPSSTTAPPARSGTSRPRSPRARIGAYGVSSNTLVVAKDRADAVSLPRLLVPRGPGLRGRPAPLQPDRDGRARADPHGGREERPRRREGRGSRRPREPALQRVLARRSRALRGPPARRARRRSGGTRSGRRRASASCRRGSRRRSRARRRPRAPSRSARSARSSRRPAWTSSSRGCAAPEYVRTSWGVGVTRRGFA